jgi:hypothetical protein
VLSVCSAHADSITRPSIPAADLVEVRSFDEPPGTEPATISGERSRMLTTLITHLKWIGTAGGCDRAQFELRFYSNNNLVADRVICFRCGCFASGADDPHLDFTALSFDLDDPSAARLQKAIRGLFPAGR